MMVSLKEKKRQKREQRLFKKALEDSDEARFLRAAASGFNEQLMSLLEQDSIDLNTRDLDGQTALSQASKNGHVETVNLLLNYDSVNSNSVDSEGRTPLSLAAEQGHEKVVEVLINKGKASAGLKDNANRTPLLWAAKENVNRHHWPYTTQNCLPTVLSLVPHTTDLDARDNSGQTALSYLAKYGQIEAVKLLLEQDSVDPNSQNNEGRTPLSFAAEGGHKQVMNLLISAPGVDPDLKDKKGWTPLFWALKCIENDLYRSNFRFTGYDVLRLLLNRNDVNSETQDIEGRTPLSWAVEIPSGALRVCKILLEKSVIGLQLKDHRGRTLLSRAAGSGNVDVVEELLQKHGLDPDSKDKDGRTPLSQAAQYGKKEAMQLLLDIESVDPNSKDNRGRTPLWWAADAGHAELVTLLVRKSGVDPASADEDECTPLLRAVMKKNDLVISQLIRADKVTLHMLASKRNLVDLQSLLIKGYSPEYKDNSGQTPLHAAAILGYAEIANELLCNGATVNCRDNGGRTPLNLAIRNKDQEVVELLLKHSAEIRNIQSTEWLSIYNRHASEDVLEISQTTDGKQFIRFSQGERFSSRVKPEFPRRISIFSTYSLWYELMALYTNLDLHHDRSGITHKLQNYDEHISVLLIGSSPIEYQPKGHKTSIVLQWHECAIAWKMVISPERKEGRSWKSMDHFSTLPYGWIPKDGVDFFSLFIEYLSRRWHLFCISAEERLLQRRLHQMDTKGNSAELIHRLAEDLKEWAELRKAFKGQIRSARKFVIDYCHCCYQDDNEKDMKAPIDKFEAEIGEKIDELDQTVKDLLQFEFAWVSINEAHRSASIATSMKRLSWITFVFLPAMFTSSLFGMNVNILETNPDWRWYLLFCGGCLTLTVLVWLLFKYSEVKRVIQRHPGSSTIDWLRAFRGNTLQAKEDRHVLPP